MRNVRCFVAALVLAIVSNLTGTALAGSFTEATSARFTL